MAFKIPVPNTSTWVDEYLVLGGQEYKFTFTLNTRDSRMRMDIVLGDTPVISGVKIVESQGLVSRYLLEDFDHGEIFCVRTQKTDEPAGFGNLGIGLPYELVYFSNEEISELSQ